MSKSLQRLIKAAIDYGDAKVAHEKTYQGWKQGDPVPQSFDRNIESALTSAARAYATSTRVQRQAK